MMQRIAFAEILPREFLRKPGSGATRSVLCMRDSGWHRISPVSREYLASSLLSSGVVLWSLYLFNTAALPDLLVPFHEFRRYRTDNARGYGYRLTRRGRPFVVPPSYLPLSNCTGSLASNHTGNVCFRCSQCRLKSRVANESLALR